MEARDERNIRPLPPETPEDLPPGGPPTDRWRWVPIAALGVAIVVIGAVGSIMNRSDAGDTGGADPFAAATPTPTTTTVPSFSAEAPTTTTTTTTPLPPTLEDILPDVSEVKVIVAGDTGGTTLRWVPGLSDPTRTASSGRPDGAAFNLDGTHLAYISYFGETGALYAGSDTQQPAQFAQVTSFAWHDSDPQRLAWAAAGPLEGGFFLMTGSIDPESQVLEVDAVVAELADNMWVHSWGEWGFLTSGPSPSGHIAEVPQESDPEVTITQPLGITKLHDPTGEVVASTPGIVIDTSSGGTSLIWSTAEAYAVGAESESNEELGFAGEFVAPHPTGLYLALRDLSAHQSQPELTTGLQYALSADGVRVADIFVRDAAALTTQSVGTRSTRVIGLERPVRLLGFSPDGVWVIGQDEGRSQLVFVDWRNGARRYLDVPVEGVVAAVHIGG
jgi:hypothetical protein